MSTPSYIVAGTPSTSVPNPAQNLRMFCVTDRPWGPLANTTYAPPPYLVSAGNATSAAQASQNVTGINSAISTCHALGGGVVYFPPGDYYINGTIYVPYSNVTLQGAGAGATRIIAVSPSVSSFTGTGSAGSDIAMVAIGIQAAPGVINASDFQTSNSWVRDMSLLAAYTVINDQGATSLAPPASIDAVLEFSNAADCGCDNVVTSNVSQGIWFNGFAGCKVNNCKSYAYTKYNVPHQTQVGTGPGLLINGAISQSTGAAVSGVDLWIGGGSNFSNNAIGISISGNAGGVHIEDSDIEINGTGTIIDTASTTGVTATPNNREIVIGHCAIDTNKNYGILVSDNSVYTLRLVGTWCSSNGLDNAFSGIFVTSMQINRLSIQLSGCRVYQNGGHGIEVQAAEMLNIGSCTIDYNGNTTNGGLGHGIYLSNPKVLHSVITGNALIFNGLQNTSATSTSGAGLYVENGVGSVVAIGNHTGGNKYTGGSSNGVGVWSVGTSTLPRILSGTTLNY